MSKKTLDSAAGKFYMPLGKDNDDLLLENQLRKKKEEEAAKELGDMLMEAAKNKQEEINAKLEKLELIPTSNRIVVQAYPENPYKQIVKGNIIVDYDGSFLNPDSGQQDKMLEGIKCGKVIEVGPDCKHIKPGDDVYFDIRNAYPLPFMSLGYKLITELQALCIINEGLKERFNM